MSAEDADPGGSSGSERRSPSRYSIGVGLAFVVLAVLAIVNAAGQDDAGIVGADPTESGIALTEFALPAAIGGPPGDANVFQDDCESSKNPCPAADRRTPACEVEIEGVLRVCDFFDRPLVLSFWFLRFADCLPAQDELDELYRRYRGRVNFLSINVRDDLEKVRTLISEHGWAMPVGYDADGAVANLYRVGGCPTALLVYPGGILAKPLIGREATGQNLVDEIDALISASRRRAEGKLVLDD